MVFPFYKVHTLFPLQHFHYLGLKLITFKAYLLLLLESFSLHFLNRSSSLATLYFKYLGLRDKENTKSMPSRLLRDPLMAIYVTLAWPGLVIYGLTCLTTWVINDHLKYKINFSPTLWFHPFLLFKVLTFLTLFKSNLLNINYQKYWTSNAYTIGLSN